MLTLALVQPFGEGPDEINRFRVVRYICDYGHLPKGDDPQVLIPGYGGSYAFQPMLTYIIDGYLLRFVSLFTTRSDVLLVCARLVNVCFGMFAAFYARKLAKLIFPESSSQWLFSCLVVFLPQSIFIHTYVNTDSCALLSVMILFTEVLYGKQNGFERPVCIRLALGVILCALSYYNAYGAVLVTMMLFAGSCFERYEAGVITPDGTASPRTRYHLQLRPLLRKGLFISALVLLGAGWWFIRNAVLYQGDFLGMEARNLCVVQTCTPEFHPLLRQTCQSQGMGIFSMVFDTDYFTLLCRSFVAMYGPMNLPTHYYIYEIYYRIFIFGLIGALIPVGRGLYLIWQEQGRRIFFNICMVIACLIPIWLCVYYSYTWDFQPQGRYLMPMLPAFMYLVTLGIRRLAALLQLLAEKAADLTRSRYRPGTETGNRLPGLLPALVSGLLIAFIVLSLLYTVFAVACVHYL